MGVLKRFSEVFGLGDDVTKEKKRFVERINQFIFHEIDTADCEKFDYWELFKSICFELGINANEFQQREGWELGYIGPLPPALRTLTGDDFTKTLIILCILYDCVEYESRKKEAQEWLSQTIEAALSRCTCDIGVKWKDGFFYPLGAEELDKPLIEEPLIRSNNYPEEEKVFRKALQCHLEGKSLNEVVKNCYSAIEGMVTMVLGNKDTLDKNKDKHRITKREAEAYLYMTGLIIRLISASK
jgi:hypothetical protein